MGFALTKDNTTIEYVYRKNIQSDVEAIYTLDGELQARYTYDAWGNHVVCDATGNKLYDSRNGETAQNDNGVAKGGTTVGQSANASPTSNTEGTEINIGLLNPFRYRSYYYDRETKLYYLQSRYYDPKIGRFLNSDDITYLNPETLNGLNLYSYCGSNPVMGYDPTGAWDLGKFLAILVGVVSVVSIGIGVALIATGVGAGIGAIFVGAGIGGLLGEGASILSQGISNGWSNINWGK